ncbi:MAG: secondary thiamine-phosphate synthase enzyme YjbQ [Nitrospiraceae bacterium]
MAVRTTTLRVAMQGGTQVEQITRAVAQVLAESGVQAGIVTVFVQHTTASVAIIEDEPGIRADTQQFWDRLIPADARLQHNQRNAGEDNGHSHLRGQLQGHSLTVPCAAGAMLLGRWQQIVLIDFDTRPRERQIVVQVMGE